MLTASRPIRGAMFDRLDANHDSYISRDEFARAPTREERRIVIRTDGKGDGPGRHGDAPSAWA